MAWDLKRAKTEGVIIIIEYVSGPNDSMNGVRIRASFRSLCFTLGLLIGSKLC